MPTDFMRALPLTSSQVNSPAVPSSASITGTQSVAASAMGGGISFLAGDDKSNVRIVVAPSAADLEKSLVSDGRKYDGSKEPLAQGFWQYFGKAARGVANISKYGADKYKVLYSDQNWRKVENAKGRYADALLRHLEAHLRGEINDPESGKPHVDHMAWNALALSELEKQ